MTNIAPLLHSLTCRNLRDYWYLQQFRLLPSYAESNNRLNTPTLKTYTYENWLCKKNSSFWNTFQDITLQKRKLFIKGQRENHYCTKNKWIGILTECKLVIKGHECMYGWCLGTQNWIWIYPSYYSTASHHDL
jgi:hypothetical protein